MTPNDPTCAVAILATATRAAAACTTADLLRDATMALAAYERAVQKHIAMEAVYVASCRAAEAAAMVIYRARVDGTPVSDADLGRHYAACATQRMAHIDYQHALSMVDVERNVLYAALGHLLPTRG